MTSNLIKILHQSPADEPTYRNGRPEPTVNATDSYGRNPMQQALQLVRQLVRDFQEHESKYLDPAYQEQSVRQDFINKFFEALGWDVGEKRRGKSNNLLGLSNSSANE